MKAYYRIVAASIEQTLDFIEKFGVAPKEDRFFSLMALDFGDGIINFWNEEEFDKNKERIMKFFENENVKIIQPKLIELDVINKCEDDNIVLVDLDKPEIHIGYEDEFFNFGN